MDNMAFQSFATPDLARALASVHLVVNAFTAESTHEWSSTESQGCFAQIVESLRSNKFGPSDSYLKRLVRHYVARVETTSRNAVENERLLLLIFHFSMTKEALPPDPLESCYISFRIPTRGNDDLVRFRVFPRHNDVALKVWEAGAFLAEFLVRNPDYVAGKNCCELGSGVGLTGMVVAGCCQPTSLFMTDYTEACLMNLEHNIAINQAWLRKSLASSSSGCMVANGYLDWEQYAKIFNPSEHRTFHGRRQSMETTVKALSQAHVLLAADVIYDVQAIPWLVRTVRRFLIRGREKLAIFATTMRNRATFDAFGKELLDQGISCNYVESEILERVPYIFPVYHVQPRSDIGICFLRDCQKKTNGRC